MYAGPNPFGEFPCWQDIEETGTGDGVTTECERCGKPGTPRQQFSHMGVTICFRERPRGR